MSQGLCKNNGQTLLRVIETTDLEQRLAEVEKQLANPDKDVDGNKRAQDLDRNKPLISFSSESG